MTRRGAGGWLARATLCGAIAAAFVIAGCEVVLGMGKHDAVLASDDATTGGGDDAGPTLDAPTACVLPSGGDAKLRLGNMFPSTTRYDFCLTRTDGASPVDGVPILQSSGTACPQGLTYKDVTAPFSLPSGSYTVSVVEAGMTCSGPAIASAPIALDSSSNLGVYLLGDGAQAAEVKPLRESLPAQVGTDIRFVHAIAGAGALDVGVTDSHQLPANIASVTYANVSFSGIAPAGQTVLGPIDSNGYVQAQLLGAELTFGVAPTGTTVAQFLATPKLEAKSSYTMFAIGRPSDARFPEELYVCDEVQNDGVLTRCGGGVALDVTVDVFDPYLWGPFALFDGQRRDPIVNAIANLTSDVVCLADAYIEADKKAIIDAAKVRFPYAVEFKDDLSTVPDDPTTQDGGTPPAPTTAPCSGADATTLGQILDCVTQNCLGDGGTITDRGPSACLSQYCSTPITKLLFATGASAPGAHACWVCTTAGLQGEKTPDETRTACTTDPRARFAWEGNDGVLLLSRFPIASQEQYVLPSSDWRVNVLRAALQLDNGAALDAYCTILTEPVTGATRPYIGAYGNGQTDLAAWKAEQMLQVQRLIAYIQSKSGVTRSKAVLAGELYAGPQIGSAQATNIEAFTALSSVFPLALAPDFTPSCTFCADNPILSPPGSAPGGASSFTTYILLSGMPVTDVRSSAMIFQDPVIPVETDAGPYSIPLSPYYGFRTVVRVRP